MHIIVAAVSRHFVKYLDPSQDQRHLNAETAQLLDHNYDIIIVTQ